MTVYKLTIHLDATLAVQNQNGSFHYFKPSVGAEFTTDDTEDLTVLDKKFEDLYAEVIGPNFNSIVTEFLLPSDESKAEETVKNVCKCENDSCSCKPLEIGEKPESEIVHYDAETLLPIVEDGLPKEEWE